MVPSTFPDAGLNYMPVETSIILSTRPISHMYILVVMKIPVQTFGSE